MIDKFYQLIDRQKIVSNDSRNSKNTFIERRDTLCYRFYCSALLRIFSCIILEILNASNVKKLG